MSSAYIHNPDQEQLSLDNCDKEPVHIPGHIQGFATLLAADVNLKYFTYCSENAEAIFGKTASDILGQPLSCLFDSKLLHDLSNTLCLSSAKFQRERVGEYSTDGEIYDVWAHLSHDIPIIEFEKIQSSNVGQSQPILEVRSLLTRLQKIDDLQKTLDDSVIGLRTFSGFDRVMLYQFDANGDGEIKAESRGPHMAPFLGLRFPKWDIPNQAREILKKIPLRMIDDIQAKPVNLISHHSDAPPLDLTFTACRGTSPIHCEYLGNMGIRSTMTLSIVVNDKLWGLFAFHNESPGHIGPNMRGAAELFCQFFSLQMDQRIEKIRNQARAVALNHQSLLLDAADKAQNIGCLIEDIADPFCQLLKSDGLAIVTSAGVFQHGKTPSVDEIKTIVETFFLNTQENIVAKDSLAEFKLSDTNITGALALRLHQTTQDYVIFFREEALISLEWAGVPKKHIVEGKNGPRLKPRGSFEAYKQSVKNRSKPWEHGTLISANEIRLALVKTDTVLFRRLSQKEERQRSIYIAELNHRVRNILALIRSISRRSKETSNSLEAYARSLEQRITALAAAHDLATNQITSGVSINSVFETEAKPYTSKTKKQLFLSGDSFQMKADAAPIFALVVHELMTNCVKYGAFSSGEGTVHVHVERNLDNIKINWKERGGPQVLVPAKRGFGLGLIEKAIPYELDGSSHVNFHHDGLSVTLLFPEKIVDDIPIAFASETEKSEQSNLTPKGIPRSVLVLEDSMMVALDTSDMLQKMGVETVVTSATVAQALSFIKAESFDFAILDISLRDSNSFDVAEELDSLNIPFCFLTGFGSDLDMPEQFKTKTILTKPTNLMSLRNEILKLYTQHIEQKL